MFENRTTQKNKIILFVLLVILNIVLRIPSIPHEKGADSFFIHSLANSITTYGNANWVVSWLSFFGLFPYSYAASIPFSLSGIEQLTGIEMEKTILLFCIILGLLSPFMAYIVAGMVYEDFLFKYLMALFFSASQGILLFSTWEISSRGPFIIFLPLFIFILLKKIHYVKTICLLFILGVFLAATHHYYWFLFPLVGLVVFLKIASNIKFIRVKPQYINYLYAILLVFGFLIPFFEKSMIQAGSRYEWIIYAVIINIRYIGPIIFFVISGLIYLTLKKNKTMEEWSFMGATLLFVPLMYSQKYGVYVLLLFSIFYISVAWRNIINIKDLSTNKILKLMMIFTLISFIVFSSFYNHFRTGDYSSSWYMDEKTYTVGQWIDNNVDKEKRVLMVTENHYRVRSIALQKNGSSIIMGGPEGFAYGYINKSFMQYLEKVPYTDSYFYSESPYRMEESDLFKTSSIYWFITNKNIEKIKEVYSLDYLVHSLTFQKPIDFTEERNEKIYTNGILEIYDLRYL